MKKTKLKPCPFCGSDAKLVQNYRGQVRIECTNLTCRVSHGGWFDDPYGDARYAVNAWNERKVDRKEGAEVIEKGKLTMLEIEDLARLAEKFKVEFHVTIYPDSAEVELMPWCKTVLESTNTTKPVEEPKVIVECGEVMNIEELKAEAERNLRRSKE